MLRYGESVMLSKGLGKISGEISSRFLLVFDILSEIQWVLGTKLPLEEDSSIYKPMRNSHESLDSGCEFWGVAKGEGGL